MKLKSLLILVIYFLISEYILAHKCEMNQGCLMRNKFFTYVTYQNANGSKNLEKTSASYKIIYVYTNRIVFYTSSNPEYSAIEVERAKPISKRVDEENIERIVNFSDIIMDCGMMNNNLCYAQNYPQILRVKSFEILKKLIPDNPDTKCLTLPYFENSYQLFHEKIAFICVKEMRQITELIRFKTFLSRAIESFQLKLGADRYNAYNGLLRMSSPFIYFNKGNPIPVIAKLFGKKIILVTNDKNTSFVKEFSLYQMRYAKANIVKNAIKEKKLNEDWNREVDMSALSDCCLTFPGELENLYLCAASNNNDAIETAGDICKVKILPLLNMSKIIINGIKMTENSYDLLSNAEKLKNCNSKEYHLYYKRIVNSLKQIADLDCKLVWEYSESISKDRWNYCFTHYSDDVKKEITLISLNSAELYKNLNECVYKDSIITSMLKKSYLMKCKI